MQPPRINRWMLKTFTWLAWDNRTNNKSVAHMGILHRTLLLTWSFLTHFIRRRHFMVSCGGPKLQRYLSLFTVLWRQTRPCTASDIWGVTKRHPAETRCSWRCLSLWLSLSVGCEEPPASSRSEASLHQSAADQDGDDNPLRRRGWGRFYSLNVFCSHSCIWLILMFLLFFTNKWAQRTSENLM